MLEKFAPPSTEGLEEPGLGGSQASFNYVIQVLKLLSVLIINIIRFIRRARLCHFFFIGIEDSITYYLLLFFFVLTLVQTY